MPAGGLWNGSQSGWDDGEPGPRCFRARGALPRHAPTQLARGRTRGNALRVHRSERGTVSVAVVLGLLLAAIAWRRFDRARARRELESLLAAATGDGFIGHAIFWAQPVRRVRGLFY